MEVKELFELSKDEKAFFELYVIDVAVHDSQDAPRKGRVYAEAMLPGERYYKRLSVVQARELLALCEKEFPGTEWAMAYDDEPEEGEPGVTYVCDDKLRTKALAYSGRYWEVETNSSCEYCMDHIYEWCMNDVGAVHYFEKEGELWTHVM
jgi:hypothetical protein